MTPHASREQLIALREGRAGAATRELLNHVAGCAECQRTAQETLDVSSDARALAESLAAGETEAPRVEPRVRRRPSRAIRWIAAAAIIAALAVAIPFLWRRANSPKAPHVVTKPVPPPDAPRVITPPSQTRQVQGTPARPERWESVVREATASGALQMPGVLLALRTPADMFRASAEDPAAAPDMRPFGEVVESDRPRFRWPAPAGATSTVIVGEQGAIVTQSPALQAGLWTPAAALPRGKTYTWQVELRRGEETEMLPAPPVPMARFHVLSAAAKAELDAVRAAAPRDHLLLGIVYARSGLRGDAVRELTEAARDGVSEARPLLESVRNWPHTGR